MPTRTELNELYSAANKLKYVTKERNELRKERNELRHKLAARETDILDLSAQFRAKLDPLQAKLSGLEGQEPAYLLTPGGYVVGARLDAGHAPGTLINLYLAAGAQPKTVKMAPREKP